MPPTQKHRSSIYRSLSPLLGEEEAEALLSQFPANEVDELVTRGHLRAEMADVRSEIAGLRAEMHALIRQQTVWFTGAMIAGLSTAATIAALL